MITLRPMVVEDTPLVVSSWLESYSRSRWARSLPRAYYFWSQRRLVEARLERGSVLVAVAEEDPTTILGWACTGPGAVVHYVFVKPRVRGLGIARQLVAPMLERAAIATSATHHYDRYQGREVAHLPKDWTYDPYWVEGRCTEQRAS